MLRFIGARAHTCPPAETRESVPGGGAAPGVCVCVCVARCERARVCVSLGVCVCSARCARCCGCGSWLLPRDRREAPLCRARARGPRARGARRAVHTHKKSIPLCRVLWFLNKLLSQQKKPTPLFYSSTRARAAGGRPGGALFRRCPVTGGSPPGSWAALKARGGGKTANTHIYTYNMIS